MESYGGFPLFYEIVTCAKMILYLHRTFLTIDSDSAIRPPLSHFFQENLKFKRKREELKMRDVLNMPLM